MGQTLEESQQKTKDFLALLDEMIARLDLTRSEEPWIDIVESVAPNFKTPQEHFEAREQLAGCFSAIAYKALTRNWKRRLGIL
jgi:hypothetical protein